MSVSIELLFGAIAVATPALGAALFTWSNVRVLTYKVEAMHGRIEGMKKDIEHLNWRIETLKENTEKRFYRGQIAIQHLTDWAEQGHNRPFTPRSRTSTGAWPSDDPPTQSYPGSK